MKKVTEIGIAKVMFVGIIISALIVLFGGILYLIQHGSESFVKPLFTSEAIQLTISEILNKLVYLEPTSIIFLGLASLLIVQLARVALTIYFFIALRSDIMAGISAFVFLFLIISIFH